MPVSKKDSLRVLMGEKRMRKFQEDMRKPAFNKVDKDGNNIQCRARYPRKPVEYVPEQVDKVQAIASGGVTPGVVMRSADSKFAKMHREFSGVISQGHVQVSTIDGHVYGSVQKVGRTLEEAARDEGMGQIGAIVGGKGKDHESAPMPAKRSTPSPFKRRWQESTFIVEKKGR